MKKMGETAIEIAGNWKISKTWKNKNTPPVVKWTRTHLLASLMPHLTKIDHFINEPTQQHENNGNIRTIFSFLKKNTTTKTKTQHSQKEEWWDVHVRIQKNARKINQTLTRVSLIIKPKQKKYSSL